MKMTFRWYGEQDCIPLDYIKQIQGMTGVVTAVYDTPVGEVWDIEKLLRLKKLANEAGLEMEVIEFEAEDVIVTSNPGDTPMAPINGEG